MFRKTKITHPLTAKKVKNLTSEKILAFTEAEMLQEVESSLNANAPAQEAASLLPEGEEGITFQVTGEQLTVAITASKLVAVMHDSQAVLINAHWFEIDRAAWEPNGRLLKVVFATGAAPILVRVPEKSPLEFLAMFRERVDSSVVIAETVPLTSAENVRVAVRKGYDGTLFVQAIADPGIDLTHPIVRKKIEPVMERLREVSGAH